MFSGSGLLDHFLGHAAIQQGLGSVLTDLYTEYGSNFHIGHLPYLEGQTYGRVRRSFGNATICGIFKKARTARTSRAPPRPPLYEYVHPNIICDTAE